MRLWSQKVSRQTSRALSTTARQPFRPTASLIPKHSSASPTTQPKQTLLRALGKYLREDRTAFEKEKEALAAKNHATTLAEQAQQASPNETPSYELGQKSLLQRHDQHKIISNSRHIANDGIQRLKAKESPEQVANLIGNNTLAGKPLLQVVSPFKTKTQ